MAFQGDVSSYPLPDLLQWLDAARKTGTLRLAWEGGERRLMVQSGQLVATSSPGLHERIARVLTLGEIATAEKVLDSFLVARAGETFDVAFRLHGVDPKHVSELAREELHGALADLTLVPSGTFHWTEETRQLDGDWVPVEVSVRALLFEALRWVDEQPEVERALPIDAATVRAQVEPTEEMPLLERILLRLCTDGVNLGRLRLALGVSRSATVRRVWDLLRQRHVVVDGAPQFEEDPITDMLEKGATLVREGQYEAAAMVFQSLLASDPADRRVRDFARRVEQEHTAAIYREIPPLSVPVLEVEPSKLERMRPDDRALLSLVNGSWDVATLVLQSKNRELDTLRVLQKLVRQGVLQLRTAAD